jgi:phosphoribosylamine--glycine ligase
MIRREPDRFEAMAGFAVCVVLSTPPFPYSRKEVDAPVGMPILVDEIENGHLHWGEVGKVDGEMMTAGLYGWTAVVTGTGTTIREARDAAYERAGRIRTPNLRYRLDIGDKLMAGDFDKLVGWGWL